MKKLILLLLLPILSFSQLRDSVYVKTDIFEVMYSETLQQPLWVKYQVQCPEGKASRKGMDFYTIKGYITSSNEDYADNVYDKGHVAPAASFSCDTETLKKTFSYLNCTLQHEKLNRNHWRLLEVYERDLAKTESPVNVEVKVVFDKNITKVPGGAAIPFAFIKTIKTSKQTLKYYFLNIAPTLKSYKDYEIK